MTTAHEQSLEVPEHAVRRLSEAGLADARLALQLLWGNLGTGIIGGTDYRAFDKIEYRFEPDWWIDAIDGRLTNAPVVG